VTVGSEVVVVNGYDADGLKDALKDAKASPAPIQFQLLIQHGDQYRTMVVNYHGGLVVSRIFHHPEGGMASVYDRCN
jgi:hypothetical protein